MVHRDIRKYSDEFKLMVVKEYLNGSLGCRSLANKYSLPSKNYIFNWKEQLIKKGLLAPDVEKKDYSKVKKSTLKKANKTPYEKQLENENYELKARVAYYEELERLINENVKKK